VEGRYSQTTLRIPKANEENPPNVGHLYGDALPDPKRCYEGLPSTTKMQMVKPFTLLEKVQDK
jgi:hypothetical protein